MERVPLVAAVNDLSGFGRCSLTVALPILSALGLQACPLPTAVLSNHTGYKSCWIEDFTDNLVPYIAQWRALGLRFDGIYTGFLGNARQAEILRGFLLEFAKPDAVRLVDPAMADNGRLYSSCSGELVEAMARLVAESTVTTPNLTEACLLTGRDYAEVSALRGSDALDAAFGMAEALRCLGAESAVVTGVHADDGFVDNVGADARGERFTVRTARIERSFAGTGDVFASVLFGRLVQGKALRAAVADAADFVHEATRLTAESGSPLTDGIAFERLISPRFGAEGNGEQ